MLVIELCGQSLLAMLFLPGRKICTYDSDCTD